MNREELADTYGDELLFLDPPEIFDPCVVGVAQRCGMEYVVVYDREKIINALAKDMGLDDAIDYYCFNVAGAFVGERTPMFLERLEC
jgi:hypothetical protein